jgi:quercetin dioxygenase-like cupin family protein
MNSVDIRDLGISGTDSNSDKYHFQKDLNRVTIEGNDDYRLVLFFIKKGTVMPLHDHPNMSVYFKLMFGRLNMTIYDKNTSKYRYNDFSNDEYAELIETKQKVSA